MLITIFTPSYNRAHLLPRLYESLCRQTSKDFEWLVIDDGSQDKTRELIADYIEEKKIAIRYIYKPNGGMHTAHNTAFESTTTELVLCLDSDDILNEQAVELISEQWKGQTKKQKVVGMVADCLNIITREVLGKKIPTDIDIVNFYDIYYRYNLTGDKALIYSTSTIKNVPPYPVFKGEKFTPLDIKYLEISGNLLVLHTPIMEKEYQEGGYTNNIPIVYAKNPQAFAFYHKYRMKRVAILKVKIKSIIGYVACSILAGASKIISDSPYPIATFLLYPLGFLWYCKLKSVKKRIAGQVHREL